MKPGTSSQKRESQDEFTARVAKEFRNEAKRIMIDAENSAKKFRKAASKLDGKRS